MTRIGFAEGLEPEGTVLQDRVRVIELGDAIVIAIADGVGGAGRSEFAAEALVQGLETLVEREISLDDEATWAVFLEEMDSAIHRAGNWGETTAVALAATNRWICGASVGDSEAWLANPDDFRSLTSGQNRKPFLGSGMARPISFARGHTSGTLIVGTDGLFKYAPACRICEVAVSEPPEIASRTLLNLVRLRSGRLQDDVGFVICRFPVLDV